MEGPSAILRLGTETDARAAAVLHAGQIDEGFLSSLGSAFLARLYRRVALSDDSFLLIADVSGKRVGFLAGALDVGALYKRFLVRDGVMAGIAAAPQLIRTWPRALETLRHGSGPKAEVRTAELLAVAVDPESRGLGTGSKLVEGFIDEASRRGAKGAQVVVGQQNSAAVGVYSRAGFEPVSEFELHPGVRSLLMRRSLEVGPADGDDLEGRA
jgi:ribosomal protein S18 acetylase RimI-like enzyme